MLVFHSTFSNFSKQICSNTCMSANWTDDGQAQALQQDLSSTNVHPWRHHQSSKALRSHDKMQSSFHLRTEGYFFCTKPSCVQRWKKKVISKCEPQLRQEEMSALVVCDTGTFTVPIAGCLQTLINSEMRSRRAQMCLFLGRLSRQPWNTCHTVKAGQTELLLCAGAPLFAWPAELLDRKSKITVWREAQKGLWWLPQIPQVS